MAKPVSFDVGDLEGSGELIGVKDETVSVEHVEGCSRPHSGFQPMWCHRSGSTACRPGVHGQVPCFELELSGHDSHLAASPRAGHGRGVCVPPSWLSAALRRDDIFDGAMGDRRRRALQPYTGNDTAVRRFDRRRPRRPRLRSGHSQRSALTLSASLSAEGRWVAAEDPGSRALKLPRLATGSRARSLLAGFLDRGQSWPPPPCGRPDGRSPCSHRRQDRLRRRSRPSRPRDRRS